MLKRCAKCLTAKPRGDFRRLASGRLYRSCASCHAPHTRGVGHDWWKTAEGKREARRLKAIREGREFRLGVPGRVPTALCREEARHAKLLAILVCAAALIRSPGDERRWADARDDRKRARMIASKHARRARLKSQSDGTLTTEVIERLLAEASLCYHCHQPLGRRAGRRTFQANDATIDHLIPLSRGGLHGVSNVAVACSACNFGRHNKMLPQ